MRAPRANVSRSTPQNRTPRRPRCDIAAEGKESTLFWADDGVVYAVVSTGADRGRLTQIAQAVYDQMEKKT